MNYLMDYFWLVPIFMLSVYVVIEEIILYRFKKRIKLYETEFRKQQQEGVALMEKIEAIINRPITR